MLIFLKRLPVFLALFIGLLISVETHAVWQQPPHQFPGNGQSFDIASDATGNALYVLDDNQGGGDGVLAFFYSRVTNTWSTATVLSPANPTRVALDMDPSGTGLAIWVENGDSSMHSSFFNGSSWTLGSPDPFATPAGTNTFSLDMNGPNTALAFWLDDPVNTAFSAFFTAGTWSAPIPVAPSDGVQSDSAYSSNGTAVAAFQQGTALQASNFIGGSWQPPVTLDPVVPFTSRNVVVGIDSLGRAVAVWVNSAGNVQSRTFNGTVWLPAVTISNTPGNDPFTTSLDMAPNGVAVATWVDGLGVGRSNTYNGTTWGTPQQFAPSVLNQNVDVDSSGNALVLFRMADNNIYASRLPVGGTWTPPDFVYTPITNVPILDPTLSDSGIGFAGFAVGIEGFDYFASVEIAPAPPPTIDGSVCVNNFASQTDRINVITFTPSVTLTVVSYEIRRNGVLIGTIPAEGPYIFLDHGRCKRTTDTYTITAIDISGVPSIPVTVIIN